MATLHLLHGFTGAGKTTYAKRLERSLGAVRLTPDEWMVRLHGPHPPEEQFAEYLERITALMWQVAEQMVGLGHDVILDFGFWSRASRDDARTRAQAVQATLKLYFVCAPEPLMKKRVLERSRLEGALMIDEHAFDLFKSRLEPLAADEPHIVVSTST